jgi:hypothetical protein
LSVPHVRVPRSDFDPLDKVWGGREAFDSRSARLDLRALAFYREQDVIVDGKPVHVLAGDVVVSERWLAVRWGWSRSRVTRFLKRLEDLLFLAVRSKTEPGVCQTQGHLTICDVRTYADLRSEIEPPLSKNRTKVKKEEEPSPKGEVPKETQARASRRMPAAFPNAAEERELRALARELGISFDSELAQMRDYEFRNPRSDWLATSRNWFRRAAEHHGPYRQNGTGKHSTATGITSVPDDAVAAGILNRMHT